jgi:formyltetrahydrofolate deformylase
VPAFAGAGPYARARERGVKLIGATAHYVTALTRLGADIERTVLAPAVAWHCEDRVVRHGNTTVVF